MKNTEKGITLIALIITVIVLLILAGTAISIAVNGGDLFEKANQAATEWNSAVSSENTSINNSLALLNRLFDEVDPSTSSTVTPEPGVTQISISDFIDDINALIADEEDISDIVITLPTITASFDWDPQYYTDSDAATSVYGGDFTAETLHLYSGTMPTGITTASYGSNDGINNYDMSINSWKILRTNNDGTIDLVPNTGNSADFFPDLPLGGAQGYNNGVNLLNAACRTLYGDPSRGINARSINIEDIESLADEYELTYAKNNNYTDANGSSCYYGSSYNHYSSDSQYPVVYGQEAGRTINGTTTSAGLGQSDEIDELTERNQSKVTDASSISPTHTYYSSHSNQVFSPSPNVSSYWIASRYIYGNYRYTMDDITVVQNPVYYQGCIFGIQTGDWSGSIGIQHSIEFMFSSDGGPNYTAWRSLCPVVTLSGGSFVETDTDTDTTIYTFVPAT